MVRERPSWRERIHPRRPRSPRSTLAQHGRSDGRAAYPSPPLAAVDLGEARQVRPPSRVFKPHRQVLAGSPEGAAVFFDRSPVCTLALSRYLGLVPSRHLSEQAERLMTERLYDPTVFFIRNQGFIQVTAARRISFEDSLVLEQIHELTYRELGFDLVDVPADPLPIRVALIQQTVEQLRC
jgi:hypothetical protein